jgi:hypothetical protein
MCQGMGTIMPEPLDLVRRSAPRTDAVSMPAGLPGAASGQRPPHHRLPGARLRLDGLRTASRSGLRQRRAPPALTAGSWRAQAILRSPRRTRCQWRTGAAQRRSWRRRQNNRSGVSRFRAHAVRPEKARTASGGRSSDTPPPPAGIAAPEVPAVPATQAAGGHGLRQWPATGRKIMLTARGAGRRGLAPGHD